MRLSTLLLLAVSHSHPTKLPLNSRANSNKELSSQIESVSKDGAKVGVDEGSKVGESVSWLGDVDGGGPTHLFIVVRVVPSGQTQLSREAVFSKVSSQTQTAAPPFTSHSPALLHSLLAHGCGGTGVGTGAGSSSDSTLDTNNRVMIAFWIFMDFREEEGSEMNESNYSDWQYISTTKNLDK